MSGRRSALIVATSEYRDARLSKLDGPASDAEALRAVLAHKDIGGFDVKVALNSRVDTLRRTLEAFFADRARDDLLLVHFSGHGLKDDDGQLYLAAADTQIDRLLSTGVDAGWVNRLMNRCRSEKIALFLDCCFAGAFTTGMVRRVGVDTAGVKEQFTGSGLFVIAASDAMQYSFEGGRQVGEPPAPSPFTKALVDGLVTGEADRNEDGDVSINELFDYLEDRVRQTSPSQTPTKSAFNQVGDWVIARSTRLPSIRLLPEALQKAMKSEDALDRFGALMEFRELMEGSDARMAEAARQAVLRLSQDDSRRVAAAAQRLIEEDAARPKTGRGTRRPSLAAAPGPAIEPAAPEPAVPEPAAPEPAAPEPMIPEPAAPEPAAPEMMTPEPVSTPEPAAPIIEPAPAPIFVPPVSAAPPAATPVAQPIPASIATAPTPAALAAPASAEPTSAVASWSLARSAWRAGLGSFIGVVIQFFWLMLANSWMANDERWLNITSTWFGEIAWAMAILAAIVVSVLERQVEALRLPGGGAYRIVGHNRWAAAAILGALVGLTLGLLIEATVLGDEFGHFTGLGAEIPYTALVGFLIAEAIVGRRFRPKPAAAPA